MHTVQMAHVFLNIHKPAHESLSEAGGQDENGKGGGRDRGYSSMYKDTKA